jgi:glycosyltransferase involved in cell wall biosynthesis
MPTVLCIVVPCFNESETLLDSAQKLTDVLAYLIASNKVSHKSYICFVDDGSRDNTWEVIDQICKEKKLVKGLKLSANFGHQNALIAGLFSQKNNADCFVTIDADLQDDIHTIEHMVDKYNQGCNIVYGVRNNRETDTAFKRLTADFFYKLMQGLKVNTINNHADYRLADKKVVETLERFGEANLFLRGIFPLMGFKHEMVYYKRNVRLHGETKYPFRKMLSFAWQGVTSFSTTPLKLVFTLGIITFLVSLVIAFWVLLMLIEGKTVRGWASSLLITTAFSGLNMICLGIIGEYVGKIYKEVKNRPRYIIEKEI